MKYYLVSGIDRAVIISALESAPIGECIIKALKSKKPVEVIAENKRIKHLSYNNIRNEFNYYLNNSILLAMKNMPEVYKKSYRRHRREFFRAICKLGINR